MAMSGFAVLDPSDIRALAEEALHEGRELGDDATLVDARSALGYVAMIDGDASGSIEALTEALELSKRIDHDLSAPRASLGLAQLRGGDMEGSRSNLLPGLRGARDLRVTWVSLLALEGAADWLGVSSRADRAAVYSRSMPFEASRSTERPPTTSPCSSVRARGTARR
jgi:hypothetical protein